MSLISEYLGHIPLTSGPNTHVHEAHCTSFSSSLLVTSFPPQQRTHRFYLTMELCSNIRSKTPSLLWLGLTWHPVEKPPADAVVGLQVLAVRGPVHVRDEAVGADALAHFLVPLHHAVDVHRVIIGTNGQMGPIRRILQLMDGLLPVLDVHHLRHISEGKQTNVIWANRAFSFSGVRLLLRIKYVRPVPSALCTHLTLRTVNEPSFIPSARWMPSVLTAAQRIGSSILQRAISAWSIRLHIL